MGTAGDPDLYYKRETHGICPKDQGAVSLSNNLKVKISSPEGAQSSLRTLSVAPGLLGGVARGLLDRSRQNPSSRTRRGWRGTEEGWRGTEESVHRLGSDRGMRTKDRSRGREAAFSIRFLLCAFPNI